MQKLSRPAFFRRLVVFGFALALPALALSNLLRRSFSFDDSSNFSPALFSSDSGRYFDFLAALPKADSSATLPPVYPYSVIPHGVRSADELQQALRHDATAAAHYADFLTNAARPIRLDRDRMAYVSYRIGNRIFWTSKKVALHKGETLLSDGEHLVRTRCGNRISEVPRLPVSPVQPADPILETPLAPVKPELAVEPWPGQQPIWSDNSAPAVSLLAANVPPASFPGGPGAPFLPVICCNSSTSHSRTPPPGGGNNGGGGGTPPPPVAAPEPNSFLLLLAGLGLSLLAAAFLRSRLALFRC